MVKNGLPAIHPGEFLAEILGEMGLSQAEFARTIGVSPMRISHVIKGDRPVTAELALLYSRAFSQSPIRFKAFGRVYPFGTKLVAPDKFMLQKILGSMHVSN